MNNAAVIDFPAHPKRIQEVEKNRAVTMWANGCDTSQSVKAMGKKEFQTSKEKVLDVISQLIGAEVREAA